MPWKILAILPVFSLILLGAARAEALDGAYRGTIVCEKLKWGKGFMRAPLDISISGNAVMFAHPIFNRDGTFTIASEIATGTLTNDGAIKLTSSWAGNSAKFQGNYTGTMTAKAEPSPARKPGPRRMATSSGSAPPLSCSRARKRPHTAFANSRNLNF